MTKILNEDDKKLYDRQIRLFGYDTQEKLKNLNVRILKNENMELENNICYISGEVLKNFALLGVTNFEFNQIVYDSFLKMVPSSLKEINENINYKIIDIREDLNKENTEWINVYIDTWEMSKGYYLCSKCYSFADIYHKDCIERNEDDIVYGCLIGACFVQEMIKMLKGEKYLTKYTIDI